MSDPHRLARRMAKRVEAIADPAMRVKYLQHTLARMSPGTIADLVTVAVHGAEARDGSQGALLLALCLALAQEDSAELRAAVVREALTQGQHDTASLLQPRPPARASEEPLAVPDFGRGRALTLGERKSLARGRDRDLLARVLRDPHPDVIRILLGNPALTEDDVLRLVAQRPVAPEVLREVFRSTRWIVRYRVRRAIVKNPFSPVDVAVQLATLLNAQDARTVVESAELSPPVRDAARRVAGLATLH
ncbi:MAG TPA: hypothetical protein RMH99_03960 [Sandaracinaceae bacterium LLY-WYZ-13_1]|nr:hypothetical protein [Sandaracinaceae bacterium LLY-WYZ-13_1]